MFTRCCIVGWTFADFVWLTRILWRAWDEYIICISAFRKQWFWGFGRPRGVGLGWLGSFLGWFWWSWGMVCFPAFRHETMELCLSVGVGNLKSASLSHW